MHILPPLKYKYNALEPVIDTQTMQIHHTKHHQAYIDKLNAGLQAHPEYIDRSLEDLLCKIKKLPDSLQGIIRNHGGGHYNHSLFWEIMRIPRDNNKPHPNSQITQTISQAFGSFEDFQSAFNNKAVAHFGSGWCWLIQSGDISYPLDEGLTQGMQEKLGKFEIITTSNQDSPLMDNKTPLLGIDLWEHAYYLHYQNKRADYISTRWSVVDWDVVEKNIKGFN